MVHLFPWIVCTSLNTSFLGFGCFGTFSLRFDPLDVEPGVETTGAPTNGACIVIDPDPEPNPESEPDPSPNPDPNDDEMIQENPQQEGLDQDWLLQSTSGPHQPFCI